MFWLYFLKTSFVGIYIIAFYSYSEGHTSSLVFWNPLASFLKGFFSFSINFILTFSSHPSSFSIGHTEHIISLDSAVDTTVTWDWFSEFLYAFLSWSALHAIESILGSIKGLSTWWYFWCMDGIIIKGLFTVIFYLLLHGIVWATCAIECMNLGWWNWL